MTSGRLECRNIEARKLQTSAFLSNGHKTAITQHASPPEHKRKTPTARRNHLSSRPDFDAGVEKLGGAGGRVDTNDCDAAGALDDGSQAFATCGTTSLVVVITDGYVICCNTGDSRAVLASEGASRPLSRDHKPESPGERAR